MVGCFHHWSARRRDTYFWCDTYISHYTFITWVIWCEHNRAASTWVSWHWWERAQVDFLSHDWRCCRSRRGHSHSARGSLLSWDLLGGISLLGEASYLQHHHLSCSWQGACQGTKIGMGKIFFAWAHIVVFWEEDHMLRSIYHLNSSLW